MKLSALLLTPFVLITMTTPAFARDHDHNRNRHVVIVKHERSLPRHHRTPRKPPKPPRHIVHHHYPAPPVSYAPRVDYPEKPGLQVGGVISITGFF